MACILPAVADYQWLTTNPNIDFWHFRLQLSALGQSWVSCWLAMVSLLSS